VHPLAIYTEGAFVSNLHCWCTHSQFTLLVHPLAIYTVGASIIFSVRSTPYYQCLVC